MGKLELYDHELFALIELNILFLETVVSDEEKLDGNYRRFVNIMLFIPNQHTVRILFQIAHVTLQFKILFERLYGT